MDGSVDRITIVTLLEVSTDLSEHCLSISVNTFLLPGIVYNSRKETLLYLSYGQSFRI